MLLAISDSARIVAVDRSFQIYTIRNGKTYVLFGGANPSGDYTIKNSLKANLALPVSFLVVLSLKRR